MKLKSMLLLLTVILSGCQTTMEERGALLGTVAGGILGNQVGGGQGKVLATGAGMVAGAFAGAAIGSRMDAFDRAQMNKAYASSLESGRSGEVSSWKNPDTGNSGSVEPLRTYQNSTGQYCREFQQTITVGGKTEQAYGTACRQPDGTWQIIGG